MNVENRLSTRFRHDIATRFSKGRWKILVDSMSELEYNQRLVELKTVWSKYIGFLNYLELNWLGPYKTRFLRAWTVDRLHFDTETTNRAKSAHLVLKSILQIN